jgi:signal transduction histidine kinase
MSSSVALDAQGGARDVPPLRRVPQQREPLLPRQLSYGAMHSPAEQLHEVRGSIAGVANAIRLLVGHHDTLSEARQHQLEALLASEVTRLERLVYEDTPDTGGVLNVADVLEPVVGARRLAGQVIHWSRSELTVVGVRDFIAEIVNILLVNAAQHATGSAVHVDEISETDAVAIRVADSGPGIEPGIAEHVFETGVRGAGGGFGLGLPLARRLALALGGELRLLASSPGATFVLTLPTPTLGPA